MSHPHHDLDPAFGTPVRLSVMAACVSGVTLTFVGLRELIGTSDSQLSKALSHLTNLGYIKAVTSSPEIERRFTATRAGSYAFRTHAQALRAITVNSYVPAARLSSQFE